MAKAPKRGVAHQYVEEIKSDNVVRFEITDSVRELASELGVDIGASQAERADQAASHMSRAQLHMLGAGLLLLSIKAECDHGQFMTLVEQHGFEERAARRAMTYAGYVAAQPKEERARLIGMPKSKVLALASADPEVIEAMVAGGDDIDVLSVRALQERIRELSAAVAERDVQLETAQAEAKAAKKAAKKDRAGDVPVAIFDIRAEAVAQVERSRLAVDEVNALGRDLINLVGVDGVYQWVDPTARLALSGLMALQVQIEGVVRRFKDAFDMVDMKPVPMSYLTPDEIEEAAKRFADLAAIHAHEKALRDWERQQERPRGKGRPTAKPEAPKLRAE